MMIFQSKYAPKNFGDLIFPDSSTRQRLREFAENRRHNSLIFYGPYGTAKTTTARMLVEIRSQGLQYGGVDFYRASDIEHDTFRRISNVRSMQKLTGVQMPVSIVDEIDQVPKDIQYELRWYLDYNSEHGGFIFTTNNLHSVDPGLRDRCDLIQLPAANTKLWFDRARWILGQEGVHMSDAHLHDLLETCDGSIRDLMRALEDAVLRRPRAA